MDGVRKIPFILIQCVFDIMFLYNNPFITYLWNDVFDARCEQFGYLWLSGTPVLIYICMYYDKGMLTSVDRNCLVCAESAYR